MAKTIGLTEKAVPNLIEDMRGLPALASKYADRSALGSDEKKRLFKTIESRLKKLM